MTSFRSRPEHATLDPHAFATFDAEWEYTAIPVLDVSEHLDDGTPICWQGTHKDGRAALERLGLVMPTPDQIERLHELAAEGRALELPAFTGTPTAETDLPSRRKSDAANRAALERLGWKPGTPITNFGKVWVDGPGRPAGRAWLMGWWVPRLELYTPPAPSPLHRSGPGFIQPRPTPGAGRHGEDDQADDGTNLIGFRRRALGRSPGIFSGVVQAGARVVELLREAFAHDGAERAATPPAPLEGIDVSSHQAAIDWPRVARAGIAFVYVKATEGVGFVDRRAAAHVAGARAAGLEVGAYHYLRVREGAQDAEAQARAFLVQHRALGCTLRPALDVETQGNEGRPYAAYLEAVRAFVRVIEAELGRPPILYTYPGFWAGSSTLRGATDLVECPLWIAHYTAKGPTIPKPWTKATLWQYAAGAGVIGHVDGVVGAVDRNRLFGGIEAIRLRA